MTGKNHNEKVQAKDVKKQTESPYRCSNCGATMQSKAEEREHMAKHQQKERVKKAG